MRTIHPDMIIHWYQHWLYDYIYQLDYTEGRYSDLLLYLSGKPFLWSVKRDEDRAKDGLALRSSFVSFSHADPNFWVYRMPEKCTMLEMMIALAMRLDDIVFDPDYGERVHEWFWLMVRNMGLDRMDKFNFDKDECDEIVIKMLRRRYLKNGKGGLFITKNPEIDMRKAEIWYQMNLWIEENIC